MSKIILIIIIIIVIVIIGVGGYRVYQLTKTPKEEEEKADIIKVDNPKSSQAISSPLAITGQARGSWFFEASFPVNLFDDNNFLLGAATAQALGD